MEHQVLAGTPSTICTSKELTGVLFCRAPFTVWNSEVRFCVSSGCSLGLPWWQTIKTRPTERAGDTLGAWPTLGQHCTTQMKTQSVGIQEETGHTSAHSSYGRLSDCHPKQAGESYRAGQHRGCTGSLQGPASPLPCPQQQPLASHKIPDQFCDMGALLKSI